MFAHFLKTYQLQQDDKFLLPKKQLVTYALYALIAVGLLCLFIDSAPAPTRPAVAAPLVLEPLPPPSSSPPPFYQGDEVVATSTIATPPSQGETPTTSSAAAAAAAAPPQCDYSDGEWVPDHSPPLYNGTTCEAIKEGRSCTGNGQTETGYVHWRWQPRRCDLPAFSPDAFLRWLSNRHMAFVGDSLARNQAESLVCLLSSRSPAEPVPGAGGGDTRFRRWAFPEHNATVSIFWSPFLVRGVEKSERDGVRHNELFLDAFDERWMSELGGIDALVLSAGHWFKIPSVYHERGGVVGCHGCAAAELNGTETSFLAVFRDAVRRTLAEVARRHEQQHGGDKEKVVTMATFSPSHFEGDWDKGAPCPKKQPYKYGEKELGYTETELRKIVVEAVADARAAASSSSSSLRFAALDVTTLANLRPDGHPGPYMRKNPFAAAGNGRPVQNDCLHWCMPGPVDTFNQILLQTVLR